MNRNPALKRILIANPNSRAHSVSGGSMSGSSMSDDYVIARGKIMGAGRSGMFGMAGTLFLVLLFVILVWSSIAYVPAGHVGVLTLFGRVTGQVLTEGTHFVNPFAVNNT